MENQFLSKLGSIAFHNGTPFSGQFELTPVCNLNCKMCYIHKPEEDGRLQRQLLPASFWLNLAQQVKDAGTLVLSLTGGETLLYPELDILMDRLSRMGFLISFNTNGTLIDEKRVAWFRHYAPTKINITLYGACNETYQKLCGISDGFDRVSWSISHLQKAGLNVYLNAVVAPEHVDELPRMRSFAQSFGLELHTATYLFPKLDTNDKPYDTPHAHRLSASEAAEFVCRDMEQHYGKEEFCRQAASIRCNIAYMSQTLKSCPTMKKCRAARCMYAVNWQGRLRPCSLLSAIDIPLYENNRDFASAWEELKERFAALKAPEKCLSCGKQQICPVCKAALYRETGGFDKAPEYLCEYSERLEQLVNQEKEYDGTAISNGGDLYQCGCHD